MFTRNRTQGKEAEGPAGTVCGSLLRAGCSGASHTEWVRQAIQELKDEKGVDRVGVWLEEVASDEGVAAGPVVFRGDVCEQGTRCGVPEWARLSGDAPMPAEMLSSGKSCEYEIEGPKGRPIFGPMVELQRVLWVPVLGMKVLRGLVMLGTQQKHKSMPREKAEQVAEELGLLLDIEAERRLAAARKADLELLRRMQRLISEPGNAGIVLGQLAESCTGAVSLGGAGAVFALIGERKSVLPVAEPSWASGEEQLVIRGQSGEEAWAHGVNGGPLETVWRQAVENRRAFGVDAGRLPLAKNISRIVAIPLELGKEIAAVLIAGLPRRAATLELLERLELRGRLAAEVLAQERRAKTALREEQWQQALLESSEEPVVLVDRQGLIVGMSRGARDLTRPAETGFAPDSGTMRFVELFRPRHWEAAQQWVQGGFTAETKGEGEMLECELRAGICVALSRLALSTQEFSAAGMAKMEKEKHVLQSEEVHEAVTQALEWLDEGVVVFDDRGKVLALNARFLQIMGFREEERDNLRTLEEVIQGTAKNAAEPELFAADWRALAANCADGTQEDLVMEKPVPQLIERFTRPIAGPKGQQLGRAEVYREMTARRMFQSRMVQTEKLASLGQRVSGIMHELSNPLTTILGNAQRMVLRGSAGAPGAEGQQILKEAERATGILRQLLLLSRDTRPELRLLSVNDLVTQTVELQNGPLAGSPLRLEVETTEPLPRVRGDFGQLQQVLLNLLQNAQQAAEESGRGSAILVRTASGGPGRVRLEVWDDGPGIPEALQARIFDPFFTTKPAGKGTGLGLEIVRGFVRQHGGTVSVHCPPGGGTQFVVELPAAEEAWQGVKRGKEINTPQPRSLPDAPPQRRSIAGTTKEKAQRILVVEDEPTVASLIADVLRDEGMHVDVLPDGRRALDLLQHESYDLAICDLRMPGMDGQNFYAALLQSENPLREHILFVTGDVVAQRTQDFLERHHLHHVAKPFRVEELTLAVRTMLSGRLQATAMP